MGTIEIKSASVRDGEVLFTINKLGGWADVSANRHKLNTGVSLEPVGSLVVSLPVEEIKEGDILTIEQVAQLLQDTLKLTIPTCRVFVEQANDDFKKEDF